MTNDEMSRPARLAVGQLIQHYDYVQIFAGKWTEKDGTQFCAFGDGNQITRDGHCKMWLAQNDEIAREKMRPHHEPPQDWEGKES